MSARDELDQIRKKGREAWLRLREQQGPSPTLEELQATAREDWLKARQQRASENHRAANNLPTGRAIESEPKNLPSSQGKEIDDDLN